MNRSLDSMHAFEADLDANLYARHVFSFDANSSLGLAANVYEATAADSKHYALTGALARGMIILAPRLVSGAKGSEPIMELLIEDLRFASHYYSLREYLYFSHNVPEAMHWSFTKNRIEVRFIDPTIPRQFFTVFNDWMLDSRDIFASFAGNVAIRKLLKGESEGLETDRTREAWKLIEQEVDIKLRAYFSILDEASNVDLGGYTYQQFVILYRQLLAKGLYHRYLAELNNTVGAIFISDDELTGAVEQELGIPKETMSLILPDIVFDANASLHRIDASYFSLLREGGAHGRIVMRPHHFCTAEGIVNLLRVVAQRRPETFLKNLSADIGKRFVLRVKCAFEAEGFICRAEVALRKYDPRLPDIDLLVISEEPTLGFVLFVCELKSPIPPRWAKDQLKVLNRDSVSKAFKQAEAIRNFLGTQDGVRFLRKVLPKEGISHFDGFVVAVNHLIITSDNAGMFFGNEPTKIINFRTLERLLRRSDGDIAFILRVLSTYNEDADRTIKTAMTEFKLGSRVVAYEGVTDSPLLDFPKVKWRSGSERQEMIDQFIADGAHPFDAL